MKDKSVRFQNIEKLRKLSGLSVEQLMAKFGYSRDTYYRVWQNPESGSLQAPDIIRLHELFGVSTDCILDIVPIKVNG